MLGILIQELVIEIVIMPKANRRAGENIRNLAFRRRFKAAVSFVAAGGMIIIPVALVKLLERLLQQLAASSSTPPPALAIPPLFYLVFVLVAAGLVANGMYLLKRAKHADQGAQGEEDMAQELSVLEQENWQIEYGMRLGSGLGDADIAALSPQGKAFVIDVKSHRGTIITDGKQLQRQMGNEIYPFEKNFLGQVMKQAFQVRKQKGLSFVTPVLAFSNAKVSLPPGKLQNVYVVEKARLVPFLRSMG